MSLGSGPCHCGAHRLHRVFRYMWENPSARRQDMAKALSMTLPNTWKAVHELRKRDLAKTCVECFRPEVSSGVCHNCGAERDNPNVRLDVGVVDQASPTNMIHAGNLLGGLTPYQAIGFKNHWMILKRRVERGLEGPLLTGVKSDVMNELKGSYPDEAVTNEAGRLCIKEVAEFVGRYPRLARSRNVRTQLAERMMDRMKLLHPRLGALTPLPEVER